MTLINERDFLLRTVISADESGIEYDKPKSEIENIWDVLGIINSKVAKDFEETVFNCKLENSVFFRNLELINNGQLEKLEVEKDNNPNTADDISLHKFIRNEITQIIEKESEKFKNMIEEEKRVYNFLNGIQQRSEIHNGKIRIYFDDFNYINYGDDASTEKSALVCQIEFRELKLVGFIDSPDDIYSKLQLYYDGQKVIQEYSYKHLKIKIFFGDPIQKNNKICVSVLNSILNGENISDLKSKIIILLSKYVLRELIGSEYEIEKSIGTILEDGIGETYFIIDKDDVYKVLRKKDDFKIAKNGECVCSKII